MKSAMRMAGRAICLAALAAPGVAWPWGGDVIRSFDNPNPSVDCEFGHSVAGVGASGVLVGARKDDTTGSNAGRAYLFDASGPLLLTFENPEPTGQDQFGYAAASGAGYVAISAPLDDFGASDTGTVYVFEPTTGTLVQTIHDPAPGSGNQFGFAVADAGGKLLVGARRMDDLASDSGIAYLFDPSTGALLQTFRNPLPVTGDEFGSSVAAYGANVVIGTPQADAFGTDAGVVYVMNAATGGLVFGVNNPEPGAFDNFGKAVAAAGDYFVVGSPLHDRFVTDEGSAYVFDGATGLLSRALRNPTVEGGDQFGGSVGAATDFAVVGAYRDKIASIEYGALHIFDARGGYLRASSFDPPLVELDDFAFSLGTLGDNHIAGAPFDDTAAADSGKVYLIRGYAPLALNAAEQWADYE